MGDYHGNELSRALRSHGLRGIKRTIDTWQKLVRLSSGKEDDTFALSPVLLVKYIEQNATNGHTVARATVDMLMWKIAHLGRRKIPINSPVLQRLVSGTSHPMLMTQLPSRASSPSIYANRRRSWTAPELS